MVKIKARDFKNINAEGKDLVDVRPQVRNVYFAFLKEVPTTKEEWKEYNKSQKPDEVDGRLKIDPVSESKLWKFDKKRPEENLSEFAKRNETHLDDLYEKWLNANIMIKVEVDMFIGDGGRNLIGYDLTQVSNESDYCYVSADALNPLFEEQFSQKLDSIEKYKSVYKNASCNKRISEIIRLKNVISEKHIQLEELKIKINDYSMISAYPDYDPEIAEMRNQQFLLELDLNSNINKLQSVRSELKAKYVPYRNKVQNALKVADKAKHAVMKISDEELTGRKNSLVSIDIGGPLNALVIRQKVYLIVETIGVNNGEKIKVRILQKAKDYLMSKDEPYSFLDGESESDTFVVEVGKYELEETRLLKEEIEMKPPHRYSGFTVNYDHTITYKNKIYANSELIQVASGEKVTVQRSLIQFTAGKKREAETSEWERRVKEEESPLYLEVKSTDKHIHVKGTNKDGNGKGEFFFAGEDGANLSLVYNILIKEATDLNYRGHTEGSGMCAKWTYNHAFNYMSLLRGDMSNLSVDANKAAGGDANGPGYHSNLEALGYTRIDKGTVSKDFLMKELDSGSFDIADVVAYWAVDSNIDKDEFDGYKKNGKKKWVNSHKRFGHTQMYTATLQSAGESKYKWITDDPRNFRAGFVYTGKSAVKYRYIVFKAPKG